MVIATTGKCTFQGITQRVVKQKVTAAGAKFKVGLVTAETTVLVVGTEPNKNKIQRAGELLTPTIDYPGLFAILEGHRRTITDHDGLPLLRNEPMSGVEQIVGKYSDLIQENKNLKCWIESINDRESLAELLKDKAMSIDTVISLLENGHTQEQKVQMAKDTLNALSMMLRNMAIKTKAEPRSHEGQAQ